MSLVALVCLGSPLYLVLFFFCCNTSMGFEQKIRAIQTKLWNVQAVCTLVLVRGSISGRGRRRRFQLPGPHNFFVQQATVSSFSLQTQSWPTSLSFHLHVISVFRLLEAVPPLHRAWCIGARPTTSLGCDVMHCGRSTKFRRFIETAGPSEKWVPFYLISWWCIPLDIDSS